MSTLPTIKISRVVISNLDEANDLVRLDLSIDDDYEFGTEYDKFISFEVYEVRNSNNFLNLIDIGDLSPAKTVKHENIRGRAFSCDFQVPKQTKDLGYSVRSSLDTASLAIEFGLDQSSLGELQNSGRVSAEIVFREGKVVSQSFIFLKQNGEQWTGPVHLVGDIVRTGENETPESETLLVAQINNYKIQDFRSREGLSRKVVNDNILNLLNKSVGARRTAMDRLIGVPLISQDSKGHAMVIFPINLKDAAKSSSQNPELFEFLTKEELSYLIDQTASNRKVEVTRTRISKPDSLYDFSEDDRGVLVGKATKLSVYDGLENNHEHFGIVDWGLSERTVGKYYYSIKISLTDLTQTLFQEILESIIDFRGLLESLISWSNVKGMYDHTIGKWLPSFYEGPGLSYRKPEIVDMVINYLKAKRYLGDKRLLEGSFKTYSALNVISLIDPATSNLDSLYKFRTELDEVIGAINDKVKLSTQSSAPIAESRRVGNRIFSYEKSFRKNTVDVDSVREYAAEILFEDSSKEGGMKKLPFNEYLRRATLESEKYRTDVSGTDRVELGYLTPTSFRVGDRNIDVTEKKKPGKVLSERLFPVRSVTTKRASDLKKTRDLYSQPSSDSSSEQNVEDIKIDISSLEMILSQKYGNELASKLGNTSKELPPQLTSAQLSPKANELTDYDMYYAHYKNIARVEAFVGFGRTGLINDREWVLLTEQVVKDVVSAGGKNILCRLVRYDNTELGVRFDEELQIYNGNFIIDVSDADQYVSIEAPRATYDFGTFVFDADRSTTGFSNELVFDSPGMSDDLKNQLITAQRVMSKVPDTKDLTTAPLILKMNKNG